MEHKKKDFLCFPKFKIVLDKVALKKNISTSLYEYEAPFIVRRLSGS